MRLENDTVVMIAGFAVLAVSVAVPMMNQIAEKQEVQEVAARASELKQELMESSDPAAVLKTKVGRFVDGLSPDVALADARADERDFVGPLARSVAASPQEASETEVDCRPDAGHVVAAEWDASGHAKMGLKHDSRGSSWTWGDR